MHREKALFWGTISVLMCAASRFQALGQSANRPRNIYTFPRIPVEGCQGHTNHSSNYYIALGLIGSVTAAKKLFDAVGSEQCNPEFLKGGVGLKNVIETVEEWLGWEHGEQRRPFLDAEQSVLRHLGSQIQRFCSRTKIVRAELVLRWVTTGESSVLYVFVFFWHIGRIGPALFAF
ncbi:uncharacterized protein PgNI_01145 [Pyricularia grisea]|uniref:Uncharacterized protein n=1 Tax=Pyricularia grisea TaxID=148305 RepID=A0A6P8BF35_PYRGI|nr:uncharacterized protein PgNI_01145 [Pyricularia grisea]TLD15398.1 hypothetical protein PgNI_01145 [Pyricularia grisea]